MEWVDGKPMVEKYYRDILDARWAKSEGEAVFVDIYNGAGRRVGILTRNNKGETYLLWCGGDDSDDEELFRLDADEQ